MAKVEIDKMVGARAFNTDKGAHGYYPAYFDIAPRIQPASAICEIGVLYGGSLDFWKHLFPKAKVVGVDINDTARWPSGTTKIIMEQTSPDLPKKLREIAPNGYDLIVDDASHIAALTKRTWENCWRNVRPGGYYVIEDWQTGFPNSVHYEEFGTSSVDLAKEFLMLLDEPGREDIESIEYRHGLIIFRRTAYPGMQGYEKTQADLMGRT